MCTYDGESCISPSLARIIIGNRGSFLDCLTTRSRSRKLKFSLDSISCVRLVVSYPAISGKMVLCKIGGGSIRRVNEGINWETEGRVRATRFNGIEKNCPSTFFVYLLLFFFFFTNRKRKKVILSTARNPLGFCVD